MRLAAALCGALATILLYVAVIGISVDASGMRADVAARLTQSLGRDVRFDGPLQIEISARPKLRIGGLHVANAPGFDGGDFASLGEAHLALNLWALLRMRFEVEELGGGNAHVRLQMSKKGGNWTFKSAASRQEAPQTPAAGQSSAVQASRATAQSTLARLDIRHVQLEKLDVEFIGLDGKSHYFELESLTARLPAGKPLTLALHGTVEKTHPYKLEFTGGPFADLVTLKQPWPVALSLEFMSSRLALNGEISETTGAINFGLGTENLAEFERLLQTELPPVGVAGIAGDIKYAPGKVALENLNGVMGKTTLTGSLTFDYSGEIPSVQGALTLPTLDLRPFMTGKPSTQNEPSRNLAELYRDIANASFSLKRLNDINADLTLSVGEWLSLPGDVRDATLQVKVNQGRLSMPVRATVADVALSGSASADASLAPARFKLALAAHRAGQANLIGLFPGVPNLRGELQRFNLRIAARGDRGSELMKSLDVHLDIEQAKLAYGGNEAGRPPVHFTLEELTLALPSGKPLRGEARGSLLDSAFSTSLRGGTLTAILLEENTPVDFELRAGSAKAEVHALLRPPAARTGLQVDFNLSAPHSGEIATWLGLKPGADTAVNLQGNFEADEDRWHLTDFTLQLGRTKLAANLQRTYVSGRSLTQLQLSADLIDVEELQSLLPESKDNEKKETAPAAANLIDIPILPNSISLADADINVRIKRITSASPLVVRDLRFDGRIRDGMMLASPFGANVADSDFNGTILLDLRTRRPHSVLELSTNALDIGGILAKLGIAKGMDAGVDRLALRLDLHSSRLGTLLAQSDLALNFEGGHLTLRDANTGGTMRIALDSGVLASAPGTEVNLGLSGSVDNAPVYIGIISAKAADLINPKMPIPFKFNATTSGATIQLAGDIDRPFAQRDIELTLAMTGDRFDNLNALAHASLPPWGPWAASGKFHMTSGGYEISSLLLQVGSSELRGDGKLDTTAQPPRLDVALKAPTIQLDDFRFGNWSPEKSTSARTEEPHQPSGKTANTVQQILSPEVMRRQNAYLTVEVGQVVSGKDMLGSGRLDAKLEHGRAEIGPVIVDTPGGSAQLRIAYEPREKDVALNLQADVKHFDYGILARRVDPQSQMRGTFSLSVDVDAHAPNFSELMRYGKGHVDFAVWPENLKAGTLDLWAVNMLAALLPKVDPTKASRVNCAIGRFVLKDGMLTDKTFLIDTSRMRVTGKGKADFAKEEVELYMRPRAKTPQFLSFAIPIELSGTFDDFHISVRPEDLLETVTQFLTSVIWVPLQSMFGKETPADGHDVCTSADFG